MIDKFYLLHEQFLYFFTVSQLTPFLLHFWNLVTTIQLTTSLDWWWTSTEHSIYFYDNHFALITMMNFSIWHLYFFALRLIVTLVQYCLWRRWLLRICNNCIFDCYVKIDVRWTTITPSIFSTKPVPSTTKYCIPRALPTPAKSCNNLLQNPMHW